MNNDETLRQRWFKLCGLDGPGKLARLAAVAAKEDFDTQPMLRAMLAEHGGDFVRWWHGQDVTDWALTRATGDTDWALLALARAASEVSELGNGRLH